MNHEAPDSELRNKNRHQGEEVGRTNGFAVIHSNLRQQQ